MPAKTFEEGNLAVKIAPSSAPLAKETNEIVTQAENLKIQNQDHYKEAANDLMRIKGVLKKIDETFDPIISDAHKTHKSACDAKKSLTDPLTKAEKNIKKAMIDYDDEQEQIAKKLEEKLQKEAEAKAAEKKQALLDQADLAIELGADDTAEELLNQADTVQSMTPLVSANTVSVGGIAKKKTWKAKVVNEKAVPAYFGDFEIRKVDQGILNKIAQMTSGTAKIPGIEFYEERGISARSM